MKKFKLLIASTFLLFSFIQLKEEIGLASYYSSHFEGRRTASGEVFTQKKLNSAMIYKIEKLQMSIKLKELLIAFQLTEQ